jgi:hypothetical protein
MTETPAALTPKDSVLDLLKSGEMSCHTLRFKLRELRFQISYEGFYTMMADLIRTCVVSRRDLPRSIAPGFLIQQPHFRLFGASTD